MLQSLHEKIKGWFAAVVIAALSLTFVLWGVEYYLAGAADSGKVVAKVDGVKITENELDSSFRQIQRQASVSGITLTSEINQQLKAQALENLIMQKMLQESSKKMGLQISPVQVNQLITSLPELQENGLFSEQRYEQLLFSNSMTSSEFMHRIQNLMLVNQMQFAIVKSAFLLPSELADIYKLSFQKRSFGFVVVPVKRFLSHANVTDAMVNEYYKQNKSLFQTPEQVSIDYLELSPADIAKTVKVSDAQVKQYYENNIGHYKTPTKWTIERIFQPVLQNAKPADVQAAQNKLEKWKKAIDEGKETFDKLMQQQNGITQNFTSLNISGDLAVVLTELQVNKVSKVFRTARGFNLIRMTKIVPSQTNPFESVKNEIKTNLVRTKVQQILSSRNDTLSNLTYTNPTSLQAAATALKINIKTSTLFSRQGTKTGIASYPSVVAAAFTDDVLQQGNNSDPISLNDGSVIVLRVKEHKLSADKPLSEVKNSIREKLVQQWAEAQASLLADKLQKQIQSSTESPTKLAKNVGLTWQVLSRVARTDKTAPAEVINAAFQQPYKEGLVDPATVALANGDTAVVNVMGVDLNEAVNAKQAKLLSTELVNFLGGVDYRIYVQNLRQAAKVTMENQK